jgi:hypothetical protein
MNLRLALHFLVLSTGILAAVRGPVQGADANVSRQAPLRYARVASEGASVLNLADDKAKAIAQLPKGGLVAVYKETPTGWLEVEIPGGFSVWVFGSYLRPTEDPAFFEVTGNAVNLRPRPSSDLTTDVNNFPLPQRLQAGDKLRLIELADASKPLAETWAHVWSPPGVHGWLKGATLAALDAGEDGAKLWSAALSALPVTPPPSLHTTPPPPPSEFEKKAQEGQSALEAARSALERERAKETPDYDAVEQSFHSIVALGGTAAIEARAELRTIATLREASALKADLQRERARRAEEVLEQQQQVWAKSREKDPFGGVFSARGVVERRTGADGVVRFYLRFGGDIRCELSCTSGRYDFTLFAGTEVGVQGSEVASRTGEVPTYEVTRLEVLAVR